MLGNMSGPRVSKGQKKTCSVYAMSSRRSSIREYTLLPNFHLLPLSIFFQNLEDFLFLLTVFTHNLPLKNSSYALSSKKQSFFQSVFDTPFHSLKVDLLVNDKLPSLLN